MFTVPFSDLLFLDKFLGRNDIYKMSNYRHTKEENRDTKTDYRQTERLREETDKNETKQ